jgi:putative peptidoglycan lipid II flippase
MVRAAMGLISKFLSVGSATMASRVLGFVREALVANTLGTGPVADAFYAAFRFPNLFRRLFAEGAFNTAFIPLFAKELEAGGRARAQRFGEEILSALLFVLIAISALAMIFMPFLVGTIIAPKFASDPAKFNLTVDLTRIMFPYLTAMSLVAMFSGILNSFRRYFLPALAPVLLNVVLVSTLLICRKYGVDQRLVGQAMAWGVAISGLLQFALLVYGLKKEEFGMRLRLPQLTPGTKRLLVLAVPTAIASGITQINLLVGQIIASAQAGAISVMNYADRLMQLPLGVIAISIGVVLLPELTRALAAGKIQEAERLQNKSIEFGLGLTVPSAVGLFMLPATLVALLFEHGAFTRESTLLTADVLAAFAVGLPSFVLIKIFQPSFYSRQDMKTPMWYSGINALVNITLSLFLFPKIGVMGLAIATSVAGWVNAILLAGTLYWKNLFRIEPGTAKNCGIILFASLAMGMIVYGGKQLAGNNLLDGNFGIRLLWVVALILLAGLFYGIILLGSGVLSRQQFSALWKRDRTPKS